MMSPHKDLVVASLLSPPAPSGIAVIAVRGNGAESVVSQLFKPARSLKNPLPEASRASYGFMRFQGQVLDEVLLIRKQAQDQAFEVCCHGGMAAATAILEALAASGASIRPWSELVPKETLDHDLLTALLQSRGSHQSALLAHLFSGSLREAFVALERALRSLEIDGVEKNGGSPVRDAARGVDLNKAELKDARTLADRLVARYDTGRFLDRAPRVFLTGPPNAGKSTLFNAIVGERRVLTSKIPGTTRDTVEAVFQLEGFPVRLFDTPGFAVRTEGDLDQRAQDVAKNMMMKADLCLHLIEPGKGDELNIDPQPACIDSLPGSHMAVVNKADLLAPAQVRELDRQKLHRVSALRAEGIESLLSKVDRCLGLDRLRSDFEPWIFNQGQQIMVMSTLEALKTGKPNRELRKKINSFLASPIYL